jgi:hypothetical protein
MRQVAANVFAWVPRYLSRYLPTYPLTKGRVHVLYLGS